MSLEPNEPDRPLGDGDSPIPNLGRWQTRAPQVRKLVSWLKKRGHATADEVVEWDRQWPIAQRLLTWDDTEAAVQYRLYEARVLLNRWRGVLDGYRVRTFIHIREDSGAGIPESAYVTAELISKHEGMRRQVIADCTHRMERLARDLAFWKLTDAERTTILTRLSDLMGA